MTVVGVFFHNFGIGFADNEELTMLTPITPVKLYWAFDILC